MLFLVWGSLFLSGLLYTADAFCITQGKPTQAMKEAKVLEYAQLGGMDYIPGAEILRDTAELEADQQEQS